MMLKRTLLATGTAAAIGLGASALALAHGPGGSSSNPNYGWHQGGRPIGPMMDQGQGMGPGMMGPGYGMGPGNGMMGYGMGQGQMGPGMMGPTMGYGMGQGQMGPGMMGPMMGYGMGPGMMQPLRQDLTAADVKHMMGHRLAWNGNPNLKLGKVEEKDDDTIVAEIVTKDGSVVQSLEVNRHTGWMRPAQ